MKKRILMLSLVFSTFIILTVTGAYVYSKSRKISMQESKPMSIVALNEIEQLAREQKFEKVSQKVSELQEELYADETVSETNPTVFAVIGAVGVVFIFAAFGYIYFAILRPFDKMKGYAERIAAGDFDLPLDYERSNYFGEFTWAFDSMRCEITKARACEREAIENNKTVIATLSHDIKTPISSIRAYSEGLEANLDVTPEKRAKYVKVIMKKCDEVSALTNDLFIHSLSDLDKLKIYPEEIELCSFTKDVLSEIAADKEDIVLKPSYFTAKINLDKNRYTQLVENIINNARKYAKTEINVSFVEAGEWVEVHFRDYGKGIPDDDMPFIFDKFYRGKNCGSEQGSGLGLYIVKYIAGQMHGSAELKNYSDGLEVIIKFLRTS